MFIVIATPFTKVPPLHNRSSVAINTVQRARVIALYKRQPCFRGIGLTCTICLKLIVCRISNTVYERGRKIVLSLQGVSKSSAVLGYIRRRYINVSRYVRTIRRDCSSANYTVAKTMFNLCKIVVLVLASLWLVEGQGQGGTVRQGNYDVLRNTSTGPVVCAVDQPQLVYSDARSRLHCSTSCLQNQHCSSFNFKNVSAGAGSGFTCEHFTGYPYNFVVDPTCRHYAVRDPSIRVFSFSPWLLLRMDVGKCFVMFRSRFLHFNWFIFSEFIA